MWKIEFSSFFLFFLHCINHFVNCPFFFLSGKWKIKKVFCYIHLTNWLVSRFFHYKFPFSQSHLVPKIENLVTDLPPRPHLGCKIVTRFSFSKLEDTWKTENYSVKTFYSHQIGQIYITKYYFHICHSVFEINPFKW